MTEQRIPVIVLAGGASRRMGTDKRLVTIDGVAMLERVVRALPDARQVLVVIDPARPLPPDMFRDQLVRQVLDLRPGEGPLAGIEAGLASLSGTSPDTVCIVAGDMPWLEPALLGLLADRLASDPAIDLVCVATDHGVQLPAVCRRAATLTRVTALLDAGERRLRTLLDDPAGTVLSDADWRAADPTGRSLMDVDTPTDLARAG